MRSTTAEAVVADGRRRARVDWRPLAAIALLLTAGAALVARSIHREQLRKQLVAAVKAGDTAGARRLLAVGADPDGRDVPEEHLSLFESIKRSLGVGRQPDVRQWPTVLMLAARAGNAPLVRLLTQRAAHTDIAQRDTQSTALHYAAGALKADAVDALLEAGASPNVRDKDGRTPLLRALGEDNWAASHADAVHCGSALLAHGADPRLADRQKRTALGRAIQTDLPELFAPMLRNGADPNTASDYHTTGLQYAAEHGRADWVKLFLDHKAQPDYVERDPDSEEAADTALGIAVEHRNARIVRMLLEAGADPNQRLYQWSMPLVHRAVGEGDQEIASLLLDHGASRRTRYEGKDALMWAVVRRDPRLVRLLLEHSVDPNAADDQGATPLQVAAFDGDADIAAMLVAHGARPDARDTEGHTAVVLARGQPAVEKLLRAGRR